MHGSKASWKRRTVLTSSLVLLGAALGIVTQAVLAGALGLSGASDAYFSALTLTTGVTTVVNTTILNRGVPQLARLLDAEHVATGAFWKLTWRLSLRLAVPCLGLGIVLFAGADWAIGLTGPGLTGNAHVLAADSLRIMGPAVALQLAGSGLIAAQYALQGQALIQATGVLYSISVIPAVIALTPTVGPLSAALGTAASFVLMFLVVGAGTFRIARERHSALDPISADGHQSSVVVVTLASLIICAQSFVGPVIASTLAEGTVAQLSFAYRPVDVLARALPNVIGYTVMPTVAAAHARRQMVLADTATSEALRLVVSLTVPIAALLVALREPVITILYLRSAFSLEAVHAVVPTLGWYAAALPGYGIAIILNAIFLGGGRERWALVASTAMLATYSLLGLALGSLLGGSGVALSFCLANVLVACGGTMATGRRDVLMLLRAHWFRWTVLGAVLGFGGAALALELTRSLPTIIQLASGLALGGAGAGFGFGRAQAASWRWLTRPFEKWRLSNQ
jgi:putative peptidoglycan lipid II flippase